MDTHNWIQRMVDVANDYGVTFNMTAGKLIDSRPEVIGEVVRCMRRPKGNITQVFFYIFNTEHYTQSDVVGMTLALNDL